MVLLMLRVCATSLHGQTTQAADDPFSRRGWHLELSASGALETWNYNLNHEELWGPYAGLTYGLGKGVVLKLGWPLYYVSQRGVDGWMFGTTGGVRSRIVKVREASIFWEFEVGVSEADTIVPPRGTRFNFLAQGSAGVSVPLRHGVHLLTALKWIHVSNGGLPAGRGRNPDIEAVGLNMGMLIGF